LRAIANETNIDLKIKAMNNNEKFKDYYKKSQSKSLGKEFK
jgi:hypothetical protein